MEPVRIMLLTNWGLGKEIFTALHRMDGVQVALVVTRPDSDAVDPWANAVHDKAVEFGIPVVGEDSFQPKQMAQLVQEHSIDLAISHAYMRILPRGAFSAPKLGTLNIHASLLPKHKGAHPVEAALAAGDAKTGLTAHLMDEQIDSGPIVHQVAFPLEQSDTVGDVIERQKEFVGALLEEAISRLLAGALPQTPRLRRASPSATKGGGNLYTKE